MFADALLDSHHQSRRGWATFTSFGVQAVLIACLLIIPLFYTQVLPQMKTSEPLAMPLGPAPIIHAEPPPHSGGTISQNPLVRQIIQVPFRGPVHIDQSGDGNSPNMPFTGGGGAYTGVGGGDPQIGVIGGYGTGRVPVLEQPQARRPVRVSVMMEGSLMHRVEPVYPPIAKSARIQGNVLLEAVIGKDGTVQNLQVVSGHPMLVNAALWAVRQWRYRPYVLNGSPIEVDTQISVNFILGQ
jgi:protein TonB